MNAEYSITRTGRYRVCCPPHLDPQAIVKAITAQGQLLKRSSKSETRRVGDWVVKRSLHENGLGPLKRTLAPNFYRRAWIAANYLCQRGVRTPAPVAWCEEVSLGVILSNIMISQYLDGFVNVEAYARNLVEQNAGQQVLDAFFAALAAELSKLFKSGAYHADLSGKNIFTRDGQAFYFIDLDSVELGKPYSLKMQLKNHVQLYDSFCDYCTDETLVKFHGHLVPDATGLWMSEVRQGQMFRRSRHDRR